LKFPYNNLWDIERCRRLDPKLTLGLKTCSLPLCFIRELHFPEKYIQYITKLSDHAPHLVVRHGIDMMFVIAAFSGLTGSGLYAKQNTSQHSRCINSMFILLRRIAGLFMVYYFGVCTVYAQTGDDAPKSSAVMAYHD
jgi:hypothetical protein